MMDLTSALPTCRELNTPLLPTSLSPQNHEPSYPTSPGPRIKIPVSLQCGSTCRIIPLHLAYQRCSRPPSSPSPNDPQSSTFSSSSSIRCNSTSSPLHPPTSLTFHYEDAEAEDPPRLTAHLPSVLHPRVAVLLGVDPRYHIPLLVCRLLSLAPALWWSGRLGLVVLKALLISEADVQLKGGRLRPPWSDVEMVLAVPWCCASAYLSFSFTDSLMSRWLLNYAPQATIVRLIALCAINSYLTSWILYLCGGKELSWLVASTTLTSLYHIVHPGLLISKESSLSVPAFSLASFTSMVILLAQHHLANLHDSHVPVFQFWGYVRGLLEYLLAEI